MQTLTTLVRLGLAAVLITLLALAWGAARRGHQRGLDRLAAHRAVARHQRDAARNTRRWE